MQYFVGLSKMHFHVSGGLENSVFLCVGSGKVWKMPFFISEDLEKYFLCRSLENSISGIWGL
jgi:hypothetical protein